MTTRSLSRPARGWTAALTGLALAAALSACSQSSSGAAAPSATQSPSDAVGASSSPANSPSATATPTTPAGTVITVNLAKGKISGTTSRVKIPLGDPVTLTVTSDTADEIHVHGYEKEASLKPGVPTTVTFTADKAGSFEVETHETMQRLVTLQVS